MSHALILIDCQRDFGAPDGAMARQGKDITAAQAALAKAQELVDAARAAGVMVIFARLESDTLCLPGTPGADFVGPEPQDGDRIVTKSGFSAYEAATCHGDLENRGFDTLVLAGLTTECCVAATAWAAFEDHWKVVIASDACGAYEEDLHKVTLKALGLSGATISDTAAIAASWK